MLIRLSLFGNHVFEGTGGTDIQETFSFAQAFGFAVSQLLYLFGWNAGPEYLNGYEMGDYGNGLKAIIVCMDLCVVLMCVVVIIAVARNKERLCQVLKIGGLFFLFIAMCIASSSVTIRVEMRWIYVSFVAMLLLMAYLYAAVRESNKNLAIVMSIVIGVYGLCGSMSEFELRKGWNKLYYSEEKTMTDSLHDLTYGKHGNDFWYKKLIVIDREGADIKQIRAWLNTFCRGNPADEMDIETYVNFRDLDVSSLSLNSMVLYKNYWDYSDYSNYYHTYVKDRVATITGFDKSGWIEQNAEFAVYTDENGTIVLNMYTDQNPNETWDERIVSVYADGELVCQTVMNEQQKEIVIPTAADSKVNFRIENGFVDENVEINGKKRCYRLSISI